jgi:hypothetical protein
LKSRKGKPKPTRKISITKKEKEAALEKMSVEELMMNDREIRLRDAINKELSRKKFHLRVSFLNYSKMDIGFNYIEPIHNWVNELELVNQIVVNRLKEAQGKLRLKKK